MSSRSFIKIDWSKLSGSYDKSFGTRTAAGEVRAPSVGGVWAWFVDFVTANFQREWSRPAFIKLAPYFVLEHTPRYSPEQALTKERATFLAGLALGFRLG